MSKHEKKSRRRNLRQLARLLRRKDREQQQVAQQHDAQVESLEQRLLLSATTYVDEAGDYIITNDQGAGGLDTGDTVRWVGFDGVDDGGANDDVDSLIFDTDAFVTLQDAVDNTDPAGTVNIGPGTFDGNVQINAQVALVGAQAGIDARTRFSGGALISPGNESILTAAGGIMIELLAGSADSSINGLAFDGGGTASRGIESSGGSIDNLTIQNNVIFDTLGSAVFLNNSGDDITVHQNVFDGSLAGGGGLFHLDQDSFDGFHFTSNDVLNGSTGFFVDGNHNVGSSIARDSLFDDNLFDGNGAGINFGRFAVEDAVVSNNTFSNNAFDGAQGGIQNSQIINNTFADNDRAGLRLTGFGGTGDSTRGAQGNTISGNVFSGNGAGASVAGHGDVRVDDQFDGTQSTNVFSNNSFGSAVTVFVNETSGESLDFSGNWWGSNVEATIAASHLGIGGATVDFTPFLDSGTDTDGGTAGFQGDFSTLNVTILGDQTGSTGRIEEGVNLTTNSTVVVGDGTFVENVLVDKDVTLVSQNGRASTTIEGISGVGRLGTIQVTNNTTGFQLGDVGQGFTIIGIDNGSPGVENAAVYFDNGHTGVRVYDNEIVANGEAGLLSEYGAVVDDWIIDGNEFSGQTFLGPNPAGDGFSAQFSLANVPRQLVTIGNGGGSLGTATATNIQFTNNVISGTAGGTSVTDNTGAPAAPHGQGNTLVTIDAANSLIDGNTFAGVNDRFGAALRVRRPGTDITNNDFDGSGMSSTTNYMFIQNNDDTLVDLIANNGNTFDQVPYFYDGDGSLRFAPTVQDAINESSPGNDLKFAGSYTENVNVNQALSIGGDLTINGSLTASVAGATLDAGFSPGIMASGSLTLTGGSILTAEVNDTTPGTDHDQYVVTGTVDLGGATLDAFGTITPTLGDTIVLIDNDLADAVTGTFAGLSNGTTLSINGSDFAIFYNGGDGNDVVLVAVPSAVPPAVVYVDDDWSGTVFGADPDAGGPASAYGYDAFDNINDALTAVADGGIINIYDGTYSETLSISKNVDILEVAGNTAVLDANLGGTGVSVQSTYDVLIDGLDIGNYTNTGIMVNGTLELLNASVDGNLGGGFTGIGVDGGSLDMTSTYVLNNSIFGVQVDNSGSAIIDLSEMNDNNTGLIVEAGSTVTVTGSVLSGNDDGVLVTSNNAVSITGSDLSGNLDKAIRNAGAGIVNASGNWWGSNVEATVNALRVGSVDFTPFLDSGTDGNAGDAGFIGDFSTLNVSRLGPQSGGGGRIQEGINLADNGGGSATVNVLNGTFNEVANINKDGITLQGNGAGSTFISPTTGSQQTILNVDGTDVTIDGFSIQVNQNNSGGGTPIAPVGIGAVNVDFDGLTISNNTITSIGDSPANWSGSPSLSVRGAGIVLYDNPGGGVPSVTISDNDVDITSGTSFFQRAVWLAQLNATITGNTIAGAVNDVLFQFASGGASLIDDNDLVGQHRAGGAGLNISGSNAGAPITITNNNFAPTAGDPTNFPVSLQINSNTNGGTSPILIQGNTFTGHGLGIDVGGASGVTIDNNQFTSGSGLETGFGGNFHVVINSENASGDVPVGVTVDVDVTNNTFNHTGAETVTAVAVADDKAGTFSDVNIGTTGNSNTYGAGLTTGVAVTGGDVTITETIDSADTAVLVAGGTANVTGSTIDNSIVGVSILGGVAVLGTTGFNNNTTGVSVGGVGEVTFDSGVVIDGGTTGLLVDGAGTSITGLTLNDLTLTNQTGDFITLANNALDDLDVDATGVTFSTVDNFVIESKITHELDDTSLGLIEWVANTIFVVPVESGNETALDNDYTRIKNAIEAAGAGDTIILGKNALNDAIFNWDEANALASWELGNDGVAANDDDWAILLGDNQDDVTVSANLADDITIQGPGDIDSANLEGVFVAFDNGTNTGWTFENFNIFDVDNAIGFYFSGDDFSDLTVQNMHIRIAADKASGSGGDVNQNIGIHYGRGTNISIINNTFDLVATGDGSTLAIQSNTHGGANYEGLNMSGNTINVLNDNVNGESIVGIWENGHAHGSNITVNNNTFNGMGDPSSNDQTAFRITSHSSGSTTVEYSGNEVNDAEVGFKWLDIYFAVPQDYTGTEAIVMNSNTLNNVGTGIDVGGINGSAVISDTTFTNTGAMEFVGTGLNVQSGNSAEMNSDFGAVQVTGFNRGVFNEGDVTLDDVTIDNNTVGIRMEGTSTLTMVDGLVQDNVQNGLLVFGDGTKQVVDVTGTTFDGNATGQPTSVGRGDITLFEFAAPGGDPSSATFTDVTINSDDPDYAVQVFGRNGDFLGDGLALNPGQTANVSFDNVDILGTQQRFGMVIQQYADLGGFSFNDVTFDSVALGGLVIFDAEGLLDLGNTTFHDTYTDGDGGGNGTGYDIANSFNDIDATDVTFLDPSDVALDKTTLAGNFAIEDRVGHVIDAPIALVPISGFVDWNATIPFGNAVFLTQESYSPVVGSLTPQVQVALDTADQNAGKDTVYIQAGTYEDDAQVFVDNDVTVIGEGKGVTILTPGIDTASSGDARGWWLVDTGVTLDLEQMTFDGSGQLVWQGIRHKGAGGTFDTVEFTEIKFNESGPNYAGTAVTFFGAGNLDVLNSMFSEIGRIGVQYFGGTVTGTYDNNMYTGKGDGDFLDYGVEVGAGAVVDITNSTITDNRGVASSDGSTSAGVLVSTFFGPGSTANFSGNTMSDNTVGIAIGFDSSDASTVTIDNDDLINNEFAGVNARGTGTTLDVRNSTITGNEIGIRLREAAALIQGNDLTSNDVGIRVSDDAVVDAGDDGATNITGLGSSTGGNILTGYTGAGGNYAIENLNEDAAGNIDVFAQSNDFGSPILAVIEGVVFHTVDNAANTEVFFSNIPVGTPTIVFVDDDWAGSGLGVDVDGGGGALGDGTAFGYDQFATIQDAIDAVIADGSGEVRIYDGNYIQNIVVDKKVLVDGQSEAGVQVTGAAAGPILTVAASGVSGADRLTIQDLTVSGAVSNHGILASGRSFLEFLNISSNNNDYDGFHLSNIDDMVITDSTASGNGVNPTTTGSGFGLNGVRDAVLTNLTADNNWSNGLGITARNTTTGDTDDIQIIGGSFNNPDSGRPEGTNGINLFVDNNHGVSTISNVSITGTVGIGGHAFGGITLFNGDPTGSSSITGIDIGQGGGDNVTLTNDAVGLVIFGNVSNVNATAEFNAGLGTSAGVSILGWDGAGTFSPSGIVLDGSSFNGYSGLQPAISLAAPDAATPAPFGDLISTNPISALNTTFDGTAVNTLLDGDSDHFTIEDQIIHAIDVPGAGVVTWNPNNFYVTVNSFLPTFSTAGSIQRGVDVAAAGDTVWVDSGTFTENVTITKDIDIIGDAGGGTTVTAGSGNVFYLTGAGFGTADDEVTLTNINLSGSAGAANAGVFIEGDADLGLFSLTNGDVEEFRLYGVYVDAAAYASGNPVTSALVQQVNLTDLDFVGNGVGGGGGTADIQFFGFNNNATLTNITTFGTRTGNNTADGGRGAIQFRGTGLADGTGVAAMGTVVFDNVDVSGNYRNQMIGIQRYSNVDGLSFNDVALGGVGSDLVGTFGGALRFDGVGDLTSMGLIGETVVDLGNTHFRGLDDYVDTFDLEFAPDNAFAWLRADGTNTTWTVGGFDVAASSLSLSEAFEVEDRILHYVDKLHPTHGGPFGPYKGFADIQANQAFITDQVDSGVRGDGSIQRGVDIVNAGGTVHVSAGTFAEGSQIVVEKEVDVIGQGKGVTILNPGFDTGSSGDARAWWLVEATGDLDISEMTFDGTGNLVYQAFRHKGVGTFDNVAFTEIKFNESGPHYQGVAIAAFGGIGAVDVTNSMFDEIGRIGVLYFGAGTTGTFQDNVYVGKGVGDFLDYALDISAGAVVDVIGNEISNNRGVASVDSSTSAGILVSTFFAPGTIANLSGNNIHDNSTGVFVGFDNSDASDVTIDGDSIHDNDGDGVFVIGGNVTVTGNASIVDNGEAGVEINDMGTGTIIDNPSSITGNAVGIEVDGGTALIENNNLNGNTIGVLIQNGGIADLGDPDGNNITGLGTGTGPSGSSAGLNDFSGYTATATPTEGAIVNLNTNAPNDLAGSQGAPDDVPAFGNVWDDATPAGIENVVYHDSDDPGVGYVDFFAFGGLMVSLDILTNPTVTFESINEGDMVTVYGKFENVPQAHTLMITWGDGSTDYVDNLAPGIDEFMVSHTYTDDEDGPVNTTNYDIQVKVTEDATNDMLIDNTLSVDVNNVAPTIALTGDASVGEGSVFNLNLGAVTDPGDDTVTQYVVFWGDGTSNNYGTAGNKTHMYDDNAAVTGPVTVTLVDEDGAHALAGTFNRTVNNVAPTAIPLNGGPVNEGSPGLVLFVGQSDPSTADTTAGFLYSYDFNNDGDFLDFGELDMTPLDSVAVPAMYLDDGLDVVTIGMRIKDKDGGFTDYTTDITVNNVDPFNVNAGPDDQTFPNVVPSHTVSFEDPGNEGTWKVSIDWDGDLVVDEMFYVPVKVFDIADYSTWNYAPGDVGSTYTVTVTIDDEDGGTPGEDMFDMEVVDDTFRVIDFQTNASGFDVTFNRAPDIDDLNLYSGLPSGFVAPDLTVVGNVEGNINGSIIWDSSTNTLSWVKTGGVLANDTYTVTLTSAADAFEDTFGDLLDGDSNFVAGGDYIDNFVVNNVGTRVVSLLDFARGAGQDVDDTPAAPDGLNVQIDNGTSVTAVDFDLIYDPDLITINGASLAAGVPGDWSITTNPISPGVFKVTASGTTPLGAGAMNVVTFDAEVPTTAPYGDSQVLRIENLEVNEDNIASVADLAVHKAVYLGDADGNAIYTAFDSALISRVVVLLDTGFDAHDWTDAVIVGDATGNGTLSGLDASYVAQKGVALPRPEIPNLPGIVLVPGTPGIDPELSIPTLIPGTQGTNIDVPVNIDIEPGETTVISSSFTVEYDDSVLDYLGASNGSFWTIGNGWSLVANEGVSGTVTVFMFNAQPSATGVGEIAVLDFDVLGGAPLGESNLNIEPVDPNEGGLTWTEVDGSVDVTAAPSATVLDRHVFYNESAFDDPDGNGILTGAGQDLVLDDLAIATDKDALLPGGVATFDNYTSYYFGLNGIIIDVDGLANPGAITAADFEFITGNTNTPGSWGAANDPLSVDVDVAGGFGGSDRITLIWNNNNLDNFNDANEAVAKGWLGITLLANANTGLAADDVFFFGNAVGDTGLGNTVTNINVNSTDVSNTLANPSGIFLVPITNVYDFNRDKKVTSADVNIALTNPSGIFPVKKIDLTAFSPAPVVEEAALIEEIALVEAPAKTEEPAVVEEVIVESQAVETPANIEEPAVERVVVEEEVVDEPIIEEKVVNDDVDEPVVEELSDTEAIVIQTVDAETVVDESVTGEKSVEQSIPAVESVEQAATKPVEETPAVEEAPVVETSSSPTPGIVTIDEEIGGGVTVLVPDVTYAAPLTTTMKKKQRLVVSKAALQTAMSFYQSQQTAKTGDTESTPIRVLKRRRRI